MESLVSILWRLSLLLLFTSLYLSNFVIAVPNNSSSAIDPPEIDGFYKPPPGYESAALGSILRHRPVPRPISLDNATPVKVEAAWQLLYRTQNAVGDPEATVVTVLVPHNAKKNNLFVYSYFSVRSSFNHLTVRSNMDLIACILQWVNLHFRNYELVEASPDGFVAAIHLLLCKSAAVRTVSSPNFKIWFSLQLYSTVGM
jgi:hypothetical protein